MKTSSATELASRISRVLISASNHTRPTRSWNPSLENILHQLGCRDSLSPSLVARVIDPFLLTHHSLALGFFNWASQQPSFSHTSITYKSVLKSLSFSRQFNAIDALLKQVKAQKISLDASVYRSVIASLIIGRKTHNAFLVFSEVSSLIKDIGHEICNSLLAALACDGYFEYAQKVFDEMTLEAIPLSTLGFGVFIWRLCGHAELGKTLSMLDEVRRGGSEINGSVTALLIIHGFCQASRVSEAFWVLDELRSRQCKPDFMAYRIVAEAFRSTGSVVDVEKVLKKKRKLGVAPRTNDYRQFIFDLISERRICEAKELGEVIIRGNFPIDDDVLNVLIGSVSAIDPTSAVVFFRFMIEKQRFPTLLTLCNLSRNLWMVKEAYGVLQEMKKKGLCPDVSTYNSLIETCCREDLLRPAKRLWDEMFASGCRGNLKTYNILIRKFSEVGQVDEAQRLFYHMLGKGVAPDVMTYTSLLEGLCQETKLQAAFDVFHKSVEQDFMLAQNVLGTFTRSLCKAGFFLDASKLLCGLSNDVAQSDSHVILLKYLADAKEIPVAIEHVKWVRQTSPSMLQIVSAELLASLSSSSRLEPTRQLVQTIQEISGLK
ncbi:PREDICTED: pentatricopeptide repeat-containing protein At5g14080 isoform X2 [Prunus mume]|uniref:Pentatricopeptide repeat-containing protein At5g14080 isoform X2 n=1 Tax=Prunus mume TaxID=102107 RepID=A0ABM0NX22_PRUMU|nr:PREDICTED: pentatricopeptide repeat-containing protein At5g14080 isoform X2 [Prunus mume]